MEGATVVPGAPDTGVPEVRVPDIRVPEVRVPGVRVADLEEAMDTARAEVAVIAGRLNRAHADLVALTGRLVEGQLWAGGGIRSPEHWLILTAGLSPAHARDVVRLARRRQEIAPALALLDQGQLSIHRPPRSPATRPPPTPTASPSSPGTPPSPSSTGCWPATPSPPNPTTRSPTPTR